MKMAQKVLKKKFENAVGKGEIARYEQFLLFLQCFQKACTANTYKPGLVWERVKTLSSSRTFPFAVYCIQSFTYEYLLQCISILGYR